MDVREDFIQQGMEKGLIKGRQEGLQVVALNMLKKQMELSVISEVTGFSLKELKKLKK